jgi:hypothetical protein
MRTELPSLLAAGPRVIERNHGNGGQGVTVESRRPASARLSAAHDSRGLFWHLGIWCMDFRLRPSHSEH